MAGFTLKLGAVDVSDYLRVGDGEGFDPADSDYLEPEFQQPGVAGYQPLTSVAEGNREMAWPLHISGATRAARLATLRSIQLEAAKAQDGKPVLVEWKDADATLPTFYDVVFARFEVDYRHRRNTAGYLSGVLRVWTRPYGHTGTTRVLATARSATMTALLALPSVAGDADALAEVVVRHTPATAVGGDAGHRLFVAAIPSGAPVRYGPSLMNAPSSDVSHTVGDALGVASLALHVKISADVARPVGQIHFDIGKLDGRTWRALAVMGHGDGTSSSGTLILSADTLTGEAVPVDGGTSFVRLDRPYGVYDLGRFTAATAVNGGTLVMRINLAVPSFGATQVGRLTHVYLLPEDRTALWLDEGPDPLGITTTATHVWTLSGVHDYAIRLYVHPSTRHRAFDLNATAVRGRLPRLSVAADEQLMVGYMRTYFGAAVTFDTEVRVRERFTFAR